MEKNVGTGRLDDRKVKSILHVHGRHIGHAGRKRGKSTIPSQHPLPVAPRIHNDDFQVRTGVSLLELL
eukprot:1184689-Prorocentrum_minimum.AAC.1